MVDHLSNAMSNFQRHADESYRDSYSLEYKKGNQEKSDIMQKIKQPQNPHTKGQFQKNSTTLKMFQL